MKTLAFAAAALALFATTAQAQSFSPAASSGQYGVESYGLPAAPGQSNLFGTNLSTCMRNGLIGAGVGAVLGGVMGERNRMSRAVIGAAVGGVGTYFVCKYLGNRDQSRIEGGYLNSLNTNRAYSTGFASDALGGRSLLNVAAPLMVPGMNNCRDLSATLTTPGYGQLPLPQERYCQGANGQWAPTPFG